MHLLEVHKGRTVVVPVSLGYDVSQDTFSSDIRVAKSPASPLIASWEVSFATDGTDGELILMLDDEVTAKIRQSTGYMDIKRVSRGEPFNVFDKPLEVLFLNTITH